jgi:thiol:disulfide interchange protein
MRLWFGGIPSLALLALLFFLLGYGAFGLWILSFQVVTGQRGVETEGKLEGSFFSGTFSNLRLERKEHEWA